MEDANGLLDCVYSAPKYRNDPHPTSVYYAGKIRTILGKPHTTEVTWPPTVLDDEMKEAFRPNLLLATLIGVKMVTLRLNLLSSDFG